MVRRQLGAELRRLREQTGRTSVDIARELNWSDSKVSRIETGKIGVSAEDLDTLCGLYPIDKATKERLHHLNRQGRQRVWWEGYRDVLLDQYEAYIAYETEAQRISGYYTMSVPGLLQTDEYATAVTEADSPTGDVDEIRRLVQVRMSRQSILSRQPPPEVHLILDEAVIRRQIGGPEIMRRQLRRITAQAQRENILIQILLFEAGAHRGLSGTFLILDLPPEMGESLVYCDGMTGGVIRSKEAEVHNYRTAFDALSRLALTPDESMNFLNSVTT